MEGEVRGCRVMTRRAGCACGALEAFCPDMPLRISLCHCLQCQRRTGSTYGVAAFFAREDVRISGQSTLYSRPGDSGHAVKFHFCPACGSTVFWEPERMPGLIAVALGAFADPAFPRPEKQVYLEHRHGWAAPAL